MNTATPQPGDVLADKYLIEQVLGEGGMGVVYQARHLELEHKVAIKVLLPHVAGHATAAQRFRREARAAARMRGEHVCRVLDFGTLPDSLPFIVMEYLEGMDLAETLHTQGPFPVTTAVDYVLQACEALAEAHAAGIVHRDLKPANLFLARQADGSQRVKVLDFGVSKALDTDSDLGLTSTSIMVGSPLYMSPEQLESARNVDTRTDIWALGVVLYELLCCAPPFTGQSVPQLVHSVLHDVPLPLGQRGIHSPAGLEETILRALAKPRDQRFATVADFADALVPFGTSGSRQSASRTSRLLHGSTETGWGASNRSPQTNDGEFGATEAHSGRPTTPVSWMRSAPGAATQKPAQQGRKGLVLAAGTVLLGVGLWGAFFVLRAPETPQTPRASGQQTSGLAQDAQPQHGPPPSLSSPQLEQHPSTRTVPERPEPNALEAGQAPSRPASDDEVHAPDTEPALTRSTQEPASAEPTTATEDAAEPVAAKPTPRRRSTPTAAARATSDSTTHAAEAAPQDQSEDSHLELPDFGGRR